MFNVNTVYLLPGELYFSNREEFVYTVLGSCVSIIMYDLNIGYSSISHCLLPKLNHRDYKNGNENIFKYVDTTIEFLLEKFSEVGAEIKNLEVKLFGGASMNIKYKINDIQIGNLNVNAAKNIIRENGLRIRKQDTGGHCSRKIIFSTATGEVFLKRL